MQINLRFFSVMGYRLRVMGIKKETGHDVRAPPRGELA